MLTATPLNVVKMLRADRILPKWEGKVCPRYEKGTLSGLKLEAGTGMPKHRCSHWKCRVYINPQHLHPLFVDGRGAAAQPLQTQAALLMLKLNNISNPAVHRLLHVNHKMVEDLDKRLCHARKTWVEAKEKDIVFGKDQKWADVEADETTFDRMELGNKAPDPKNPVVWEQWCGIVQRGHPETLVLSRLSPRESAKRAPGPGAIRKVEWTPLAKKWLQDKKVILHTDSAKSYKTRVPGVLHDKVVHGKKRVKVKGQWKWKAPTYVKLAKHKNPITKKMITVKSGTQVVDRAWKFLKDRLTINQNAKDPFLS
ncbi:unnamed protein product [Effrenium voratum]|uniref:Transposase n=1 Tax=Effrenium voratum TaxID=2562239 RepID=A0AA36JDU4_9DINO|nr:unnamed protein product [Effrenium voratum]